MELKIICMFKIRPSVGADTTVLSKCPHLPPHQHPSPRHLHAMDILRQWEDCSFTNKEVITNFLQLPRPPSKGPPEMPMESRPYQVGTKIAMAVPSSQVGATPGFPETVWPSRCHLWQILGQPLLCRDSEDITRTACPMTVVS